ncbi:uncharacterized protein LOC128961884 [Oppia nitens]|uniref:uncharacterized protein LOC128961884 n=1 Tax=Oppia nitens TaxID=1686743 RepID=UPI0023DCB8D4|nr:uncharacterized protein LOC128961884 [Oppia nitens]
MSEPPIKVNTDLLKCENDFFTKSNDITNTLLITKSAKRDAIQCPQRQTLKTERLASNVLNRAKDFLEKTKLTANKDIQQTCDLVTDDDITDESVVNDSHPAVELNFVLFKNNDNLVNDEESSDDNSSEDSEDDSDSTDSSDNESNLNKNKS